MKRINIECAILAGGILAAGSAVVSPEVFNEGIALETGLLLLVIALIMGITDGPFALSRPFWRWLFIGAEIVFTLAVGLILFGYRSGIR